MLLFRERGNIGESAKRIKNRSRRTMFYTTYKRVTNIFRLSKYANRIWKSSRLSYACPILKSRVSIVCCEWQCQCEASKLKMCSNWKISLYGHRKTGTFRKSSIFFKHNYGRETLRVLIFFEFFIFFYLLFYFEDWKIYERFMKSLLKIIVIKFCRIVKREPQFFFIILL